MPNPYIAFYKEEYTSAIIKLIIDIQQIEFGVPISLSDQPDLTNIQDFYQSKNGNFWVALMDQEVIGSIALLDIGNRNGALRKMFVKKEFRGKIFNTGQKLLSTLIRWALENNYKEIYLGTTEKMNAAHRFYEKNEFKRIDKFKLPSNFPIMKVDTLFYKLDFTI